MSTKSLINDGENDYLVTSDTKSNFKIYALSCLNCMGSFLIGYTTAIISGAIPSMTIYFQITNLFLKGFLVCVILLGGMFGALISGLLADKLGRMKALYTIDITYIIGTIVCVISTKYWHMVVGRFVVGIGCGLSSLIVSIIITEIAPSSIRGSIGVLNQFFNTFGVLVSLVVVAILSGMSGDSLKWRIMLGLAVVPSVIHLIGGFIVRIESPKWLLLYKGVEPAKQMLCRLRGSSNILPEIEEMIEEQKEMREGSSKAKFCVRENIKPIILGVGLNFLQQATAFNAILYFLTDYMSAAGLTANNVHIANIIFGVVNMSMTFVSAVVIERLGRRVLLIYGMCGMFVCLVFISVFFKLNLKHILSHNITGWTILVFTALFVAFYAVSIGPIAWVIISEVFVSQTRGSAMALSGTVNWLTNALISLFFLQWVQTLQFWGMYAIFAGFALFAIFFNYFLVPETKGKSVLEVLAVWIK